jgi:hypothetical protein
VVTVEERVFQFGLDYLHRHVGEGTFSEWEDVSRRIESSPHERKIRAALARLERERRDAV